MTCATKNKIDSNITGLRIAEESVCIGQLPGEEGNPGVADWISFDPNSYAEFGGATTLVARDPINDSRQFKKGVITDVEASGGFNMDLTQTNMQDLLQGFFFADHRVKVEFGGASEITNVDGTGEDYEAASGLDAFSAGDLVFASGFTELANNGLKQVVSAGATSLVVVENLVDETPPAGATLVTVGLESAAGDIDVDASGLLPALTSTILDFTTLGLTEGEFIFVGGDAATDKFAINAVNNGFKRIRSIAANILTFDKSDSVMITEANATETIRLFFGRVLRNEQAALIKRRTYQLERTLGAPDPALPSEIQSEYLVGSVPNELTINTPTAEKITVDASFVSIDHETRSGAVGVKAGTRPALVESDAFNTSSDFTRIRMASVVPGDEAPTPLFGFITDMTNVINNNTTIDKAVGQVGGFDASVGNFAVTGSMTAYFTDVAAIATVRNNADITLDWILAKDNSGIVYDLPLITLGNARANIEKDQAIKLPLEMNAASAAIIDPNLDYTAMFVFFDFLPDAADTE